MVSGWGRQTALIQPGWTFSAIAAVDGISMLPIYFLFYLLNARASRFSRSNILCLAHLDFKKVAYYPGTYHCSAYNPPRISCMGYQLRFFFKLSIAEIVAALTIAFGVSFPICDIIN